MSGQHGHERVSCTSCDAVCCRLTVVVMPDDEVPRHFVERGADGLEVMGRCEDGWCVALDHARMCCSIYEQRPQVCRKFAMGSGYCRSERHAYRMRHAIPVSVVD
ncbi:MAG: YkgJ family cysteine cluster protein [Lysobacteraceae bacterium]|nr:MAG: YkgJ family cysteine cluster protein [Xanthomonadaceae bacterium]